MTKIAVASLAAIALAIPTAAMACEHDHDQANAADCGNHEAMQCNHQNQAQPEAPQVEKLSVAQVVQMKKAGKVQLVDVNTEQTRTKYGVIPGAVLLTSAGDYDTTKELPKNKDQKLVFYCLCDMCEASHMAAQRAKDAGFKDVFVLQGGIRGWKTKGQPLSAVPQS